MKFIIGQKKEMTQIFEENGNVTSVTVVNAGPCFVTRVNSKEKNGYVSVQLGYKLKKVRDAKINKQKFYFLREFRTNDFDSPKTVSDLKTNNEIRVDTFQVGDLVNVVGFSKGRGFQGVVKRHGFHGHPASHGHKDQLRMPGSIGSKRTGSVAPGKRMAGQMGNARVTVKNLRVLKIDNENNELYLKGAIPGARNSLVLLSAGGDLKFKSLSGVEIAPDKTEEPITEKQ